MSALTESHSKGPLTEEDIEQIFEIFDKAGDGSITVEEFSNTFQQMGQVLSPEELHECALIVRCVVRSLCLTRCGSCTRSGRRWIGCVVVFSLFG